MGKQARDGTYEMVHAPVLMLLGQSPPVVKKR